MDENIPTVTIFYSIYSGNSKALLQFLKQTNLSSIITLKYINIDNSTMRGIVSKKISVVPAIVVQLGNQLSLFSGENAFEWFNLYIESIRVDEEHEVAAEKQGSATNDDKSKKSVMELAKEISQARES